MIWSMHLVTSLYCHQLLFQTVPRLPGRALANGQPIWVCNAHFADSKAFSRSLLARVGCCFLYFSIKCHACRLNYGMLKNLQGNWKHFLFFCLVLVSWWTWNNRLYQSASIQVLACSFCPYLSASKLTLLLSTLWLITSYWRGRAIRTLFQFKDENFDLCLWWTWKPWKSDTTKPLV